jgi:hypothetical protein
MFNFLNSFVIKLQIKWGNPLALFLGFLVLLGLSYRIWNLRLFYKIQFPVQGSEVRVRAQDCDLDDLKQVVALDRNQLGWKEVISVRVFRKWLEKNPRVFRVFKDNGKIIAYYSILPLKKETLEKFVEGKIREKSFDKDDILDKSYFSRVNSLYLFSIVIDRSAPFTVLKIVIRDLVKFLQEIRSKNGKLKTIYVTGATEQGKKLLQYFGFQSRGKDYKRRKDKHELFYRKIPSSENLMKSLDVKWRSVSKHLDIDKERHYI